MKNISSFSFAFFSPPFSFLFSFFLSRAQHQLQSSLLTCRKYKPLRRNQTLCPNAHGEQKAQPYLPTRPYLPAYLTLPYLPLVGFSISLRMVRQGRRFDGALSFLWKQKDIATVERCCCITKIKSKTSKFKEI